MQEKTTYLYCWRAFKRLTPGSLRSAVPLLVFGAWVVWLPEAGALGVRIPNQDASAIARGNAFVATADNPSAIYYNPAGITQLEGQHIQVGSLFYLGIYGDHKNSLTGARIENDPEIVAAPTLHYTFSPADCPLSFGFGAYAPFGFSVEWPDDAPFRTESIEGNLTYITLNPVLAWKIHNTFSIAAGPTFNYSEINLVQGVPNVPIPGSEFEFEGDGWGYGFNLGVLWQPHPQWSFGASYRSRSRTEYEGEATFRPAALLGPPVNTAAKFDYPQIVIAGVSYRPSTNWNFEINVDWADWSSVDNLTFQGLPISRRLDWQSSFMYEAGVTRYFPNGYYASAGYFFSEASTPEKFFTPLVPDTDLHIGSLGGGYKGERWNWALAVQLIAGGWRNVTVDETEVSPTVNGRYRLFTPTVAFSVGYRF